MAIALDASTPARFAGTPGGAGTISSASHTPPVDSYYALCIEWDADATAQTFTVTDSVDGATGWALRVARDGNEATTGGYAAIWTKRNTTSTARTITITRGTSASASNRLSATAYVFTGVDVAGTPVDTVGANNEGGSGTDSISTTSLTPGANGVLVVAATEWNAQGACTSSDLKGIDGVAGSGHAEYAPALDVIDGWKTCTSGVGVTGNLDSAGASPQWKWCQIIVREAAVAGGRVPYQPWYQQAPVMAQ